MKAAMAPDAFAKAVPTDAVGSTESATLGQDFGAESVAVPPLVVVGFGIAFFALIFLQKIGVAGVDIAQIVLYGVLGLLMFSGRLLLGGTRLVLFSAFFAVSLFSQMICGAPFSPLSFVYLISLYLPLIFEMRFSRAEWRGVVALFQNMMLFAAGMVFVQIAYQLAFHWRVLSLEAFVPHAFLIPGFQYQAPVHWGQPLMRPNGFFLLEPSFISAFCATALIFEASLFRRPLRLLWYGAALVASTGVTGLVLLAFAAPLLLARERAIVIIAVLAVGVIAVAISFATGWSAVLTGRLGEFGNTSSSGFGRLVAPVIQLNKLLADPHLLITGIGAGNLLNAAQSQSSSWPIVKLSAEYGFLTAIAFYALFIRSFAGAPEPALAFGLFMIYSVTGGYLLSPIFPLLIILVVSLPRIDDPRAPRRVVRLRPGESAARVRD